MTVTSGGVSDGLPQTVKVNSIPLRPSKHEDADTDGKRVKRDYEKKRARATWENKQWEIMGLAVMHQSVAATLAAFIQKAASLPPAVFNI